MSFTENRTKLKRYIKDPIHDHIPVSFLMAAIIDTEQFQRLRNIKQLGTTPYVWPGASHSRFEHCLGVAHLARTLARHLQFNQPELGITDRDVSCVEIAGLCHDLGHGPWSHVWDGFFIPKALEGKKGHDWTHEDGSEMMFDVLVKDNDIDIPEEDCLFIKALIAGDPSTCRPDEKPFLFDIVANKRNGLDVDKFDYIPRDTRMIGERVSISLSRVVNSARVLDNQICFDIKDANHIYELCATRFKLHKIFYNHKSAKAIEYMIIDALLAADPALKIAERVFDPVRYLYLTDNIMNTIEEMELPKEEPNRGAIRESKAIFKRIRTRKLYRLVDYKVIDWPLVKSFRENITRERIVEEARRVALALPSTPSVDDMDEFSIPPSSSDTIEQIEVPEVSDVIVDFSLMHYGMKEKNPLASVKFYSKLQPNECRLAERGDYSNLMPQYFAEGLLRVYSKKDNLLVPIQQGYRAVLASMGREHDLLHTEDGFDVDVLGPTPRVARLVTPPITEAPSTPRAQSRNASFSFGRSGSAGSSTPFSENCFTTLPVPPASPSRRSKRKRKETSRTESFSSTLGEIGDTPKAKKSKQDDMTR